MNRVDFANQLQSLLFVKSKEERTCEHFTTMNSLYIIIFDVFLFVTNIFCLIFTGCFPEGQLSITQKSSSNIYNSLCLVTGLFLLLLHYFNFEKINRHIKSFPLICEGYYTVKINMDYFVIFYLSFSLEQKPNSFLLSFLFGLLMFLVNVVYLFLTITSDKRVILSHKELLITLSTLFCLSLMFSYLLLKTGRTYIYYFFFELIKLCFFLFLVILYQVKYICLSLKDLTEKNLIDLHLYEKLVEILLIKHDTNENGIVVIKNGEHVITSPQFFNAVIEFLINRKDNYTKIVSQQGRDFPQKLSSFMWSFDKDTSVMMSGFGQGDRRYSGKKLSNTLLRKINPEHEMLTAPKRLTHSSKNIHGKFEIERLNNPNNQQSKMNEMSKSNFKMGTIHEEDSEVNETKLKRFSRRTLDPTASFGEKRAGFSPKIIKTSSMGTVATTPFFTSNPRAILSCYNGREINSIISEEQENLNESVDDFNRNQVPKFLTKEAFKNTDRHAYSYSAQNDFSLGHGKILQVKKDTARARPRTSYIHKNESFESSNDSDSSGASHIRSNEINLNQAVLSEKEIEMQLKQEFIEKANYLDNSITNSPVSPFGKLRLQARQGILKNSTEEKNVDKCKSNSEISKSPIRKKYSKKETNPQESSSQNQIMKLQTKAYTKDKDKGGLDTISSLLSSTERPERKEVCMCNNNTKGCYDSKLTLAQIQPEKLLSGSKDKMSVHVNGDINISVMINNNSMKDVVKNQEPEEEKKKKISNVSGHEEVNDNNNSTVNQTDKALIQRNITSIFKKAEINSSIKRLQYSQMNVNNKANAQPEQEDSLKKSLSHDILTQPFKSEGTRVDAFDLFKNKNSNLSSDIIIRLMTYHNFLLHQDNVPGQVKDYIMSAANGVYFNPFVEKLVGLFEENFDEEGKMETFGPFSLYLNRKENENDRFNHTIGSQIRKCITISLEKLKRENKNKNNDKDKDSIVFVLFNEYNNNSNNNTLTFNSTFPRQKSSTHMSKIFADGNHESTISPQNRTIFPCSNWTPYGTNIHMTNQIQNFNASSSNLNQNQNAVIGALMHDFKHVIQDHFFYVDYLLNKNMIQVPEEDHKYYEFMTSYTHSLIENFAAYLRNAENFMKPGKDEMQYLDIVELLEVMYTIFKRRIAFINDNSAQESLKKKVEIRLKIFDKDNVCYKRVWASRSMLMSLFYNIISNAYKYTEEGYIELEASLYTSAMGNSVPNLSVSFNSNKSGGRAYVLVKVTDTGIGMSDNVRMNFGKAFNIEDKNRKESTGLGQFIIQKIREQLNIYIPIPERGPNDKGTVIKMYIPCEEQLVIKKANELYSMLSIAKTMKNSELPLEDARKFLSNNPSPTTVFNLLMFDDESNQLTAMIKKMRPIFERIECMGIFIEIHTATTVDQFKKELEQVEQYHFFILDYNITTELNGVTVAEMVKMYYSVVHAGEYTKLFCHFFFATEDARGILEGMGEESEGKLMNKNNVFSHRQADEIAERIVKLLYPWACCAIPEQE